MPAETTHNEQLLLSRIADGDERAFREIFDLYKHRFYGVAIKMTDDDAAADEVVQETFVSLWRNRNAIAAVRKPSSYLFTVFYRELYRYWKREAKERLVKKNFENSAAFADDVEDEHFSIENQYELMEKAIAGLPPQQAMVFRLNKIEGLSREEVAARMGISPNTVKNHLMDAMKNLRAFVKKAGIWVIVLEEVMKG